LFYYRVFSLLLVLADIVVVIVDLATAGHVEQVNDFLSAVVLMFDATGTCKLLTGHDKVTSISQTSLNN